MSVEAEEREKYEVELVNKLRSSLSDLDLDAWNGSDLCLINWIKYGKYNLKKAEQGIRQYHAWQKTYNFAEILDEHFPKAFGDALPYSVNGFDKNGWPVLIVRFGKWKLKSLLEQGYDEEKIERYMILCMAKLDSHLSISFRRKSNDSTGSTSRILTHGGTMINDFGGLTASEFMSKKCIKILTSFVRTCDRHFTRPGYRVFHLNVTGIARLLVKMLTALLRPETLTQMKWMGSDKQEWMEQFEKYLYPENTPVEFGGQLLTEFST